MLRPTKKYLKSLFVLPNLIDLSQFQPHALRDGCTIKNKYLSNIKIHYKTNLYFTVVLP